MGGDAQPQIHAQVVSALVDGGVDVATAVAQPRWFAEPEEHFAPPDTVRAEPRFRDGLLDELVAMGHPVRPVRAFDSMLGHCHAIELVDGGPAAPDGSVAAATDPRSARAAGRPVTLPLIGCSPTSPQPWRRRAGRTCAALRPQA